MSRTAFTAAVVVLLALGILSDARPAHGDPLPDAIPTWWHEAAGLTPLLTAPPPPNPATICIIDTGVTPTPDLDITARWAYDGGTLDDVHASDDNPGHGTVVAHFAAAAVNGWGGAGAFPHARISSVRVFPKDGGASWREYIAAISRCLKLDANTKVIVISIGGQTIEPGEADELEAHIERARDHRDVSIVAAAGNGGGVPDFPARFSAALAVAGVGTAGDLCEFSARGVGIDIATAGCGLTQVDILGTSWSISGTSYAAPIAAGALAAVRSYAPHLSAREAERLLLTTAVGSVPRVDAVAALHAAGVNWRTPEPAPRREAAFEPQIPDAGFDAQRRLTHPLIRARLSRTGVLIVTSNRPIGAALEVRVGSRTIRRRASRIRFSTQRRSARCRFIDGRVASASTSVRW